MTVSMNDQQNCDSTSSEISKYTLMDQAGWHDGAYSPRNDVCAAQNLRHTHLKII